MEDDLIVEVNNKPVTSAEEFQRLVRELRSGDDVVIRVLRKERGTLLQRMDRLFHNAVGDLASLQSRDSYVSGLSDSARLLVSCKKLQKYCEATFQRYALDPAKGAIVNSVLRAVEQREKGEIGDSKIALARRYQANPPTDEFSSRLVSQYEKLLCLRARHP